MRRIQVYVVIPPRLLLLDVAGPLEVVRWANHVQKTVRFEVHYVGPASSVQTSIGLNLAAIEPLPKKLPQGALIVLAGDVDQVMICAGQSVPGRSKADAVDEAAIVEWLQSVIGPGHKLISICSGALLAGRAGLLDGRACTTHYSWCAELALLPKGIPDCSPAGTKSRRSLLSPYDEKKHETEVGLQEVSQVATMAREIQQAPAENRVCLRKTIRPRLVFT